MKKLMTMVAAVGMAFGLFAEVTPITDTGFKTGASFEPDPKFGHDNMSWNGDFVSAYWSSLGDSAVKADTSSFTATCGYPDVFAQERHTQVMQLKTPVATPAVHKIAALPESIGTGLYFDAMAEMTVFDAEEEVAFPTGAKLAVYLQATDEDATGTNFIVQLGTDAKFECAGADLTPGWHRITIKAIANVFEDYTTASASAFLVFVDGSAVECAEAKVTGDAAAHLTAVAAEYNKYGQLFVIPETTATTELSEIAFGGQGLLDDIVITATAPKFEVIPDAYSIKWDADKVEVMTIGGVEYAGSVGKANISGTAPATVEVSWTGAGDYAAGSDTVTITSGTGTVDPEAYKLADAKIDNIAYTLEKAVEIANNAKEPLTITLINDVTKQIGIENNNVAITLDLAGKNVTVNGKAIRLIGEGGLVITNSVATGVVTGTVDNDNDADEGLLTIQDGTFDGAVDNGDGDVYISGGRFKVEPTTADTPTGYEFVLKGSYYELERIKNYVAQIDDDDKYETFEEAVAALTKDDQTIKLLTDWTLKVAITPKYNVTFDLGGFTLDDDAIQGSVTCAAGKTLNVQNGTIAFAAKEYTFEVKGTLNLGDGAVIVRTANGVNNPGFDVYKGATINVNAGSLVTNSVAIGQVFRFKDGYGSATVVINGGEVYSTETVFDAYKPNANLIVEIKSGKVTVSGSDKYMFNAGSANTKDDGSYSYDYTNGGVSNTVKITGGELKSDDVFFHVTRADEGCMIDCTLDNTCLAKFSSDKSLNDYCAAGFKAKSNGAGWYTIQAIDYATLTVTKGDANVTAVVVSNATEEVTLDDQGKAKFDKDEEVKITVYPTFAAGYELDTEKSSDLTATMTADATITVYSKSAGQVYPPDWKGGDDPYIQVKFADWIAGKGKDADLTDPLAKDAFLLDCAIGEVEAKKLDFKITKIEKGDDGWIVEVATAGDGDKYLNGYVNIISAADGVKLVDEPGVKQFFKAVLDTEVIDK